MTRGRCGSLFHFRGTFPFTTTSPVYPALRRTRHDPRESVVPHQTPHHGWLEERLDDASSIAHGIHLFAGRAGNSEYSLGTDESRPSAFRCNWKSPVSYGQFRRGSDTFRRGPR